MAKEGQRSVQSTDYMTDRMVAERCLRLFRNSQWKRLHDFCQREPRAATWTLKVIAREMGVRPTDEGARQRLDGMAQGQSPRAPAAAGVPEATLEIDLEDVEEALSISDDVVTEEPAPVLATPPPSSPAPAPTTPTPSFGRPSTPVAMAPVVETPVPSSVPLKGKANAHFNQYLLHREGDDAVMAGRALLEAAQALEPGMQLPLAAVEFRELSSLLARLGEFRLLAQLCLALPRNMVTSAQFDLGEKLKLGAQVHRAVAEYVEHMRSLKELGQTDSKGADTRLLEAIKAIVLKA
ncbi:MAG: hypothetical protein AB2A00_37420 [Myxococcota bacterium]